MNLNGLEDYADDDFTRKVYKKCCKIVADSAIEAFKVHFL